MALAFANNNVTTPSNVVRLQVSTVHSRINTFLGDKALNSENTAKAYASDIRDWFLYSTGKSLEQLTADDLDYEHDELLAYRIYLITKKKYGISSVNRKMSSIKKIMEYLARFSEYSFINPEAFHADKLKGEGESYGDFTWEEIVQMVELVKAQEKGEEKALLIELAVRTSIRLDALMSLTWDQFDVLKDKVIVNVTDKGKKDDEKPIPLSLYEGLLTLKREDTDKVFSLMKKTAQKAIRTLVAEMGLDKKRNLVFHSLKKVAINWILDKTGNVRQAAIQGNHKSINTTYKHYDARRKNFDEMAGMHIGEEADLSVLEGMTAEQLMSIIRAANATTQADLVNTANKFA